MQKISLCWKRKHFQEAYKNVVIHFSLGIYSAVIKYYIINLDFYRDIVQNNYVRKRVLLNESHSLVSSTS